MVITIILYPKNILYFFGCILNSLLCSLVILSCMLHCPDYWSYTVLKLYTVSLMTWFFFNTILNILTPLSFHLYFRVSCWHLWNDLLDFLFSSYIWFSTIVYGCMTQTYSQKCPHCEDIYVQSIWALAILLQNCVCPPKVLSCIYFNV